VVAAVVALTALVTASPASAHSQLLQSSPGWGQVVGEPVTGVELAFSEPVTDIDVSVTDPNGAAVPGTIDGSGNLIVRFAFDEAISEPGRYEVNYEVVSADGDPTSTAYPFTFDPAAAPPITLLPTEAPTDSGGRSPQTWVVLVAATVLAAGAVALMVWQRGRSGGSATPTGSAGGPEPGPSTG
jgi:methionine-rich copper-binding protein CopC